jgi:hypothetical protein
MSMGVSPKLFAVSFATFPGRICVVLTDPVVGADEFRYFAIVGLLKSQFDPAGATHCPAALS